MTVRTWHLFTIFAIPVRLHPLVAVLVALLVAGVHFRFGVERAVSVALIVSLAVVALLFHELGHALVAQRLAIRVRGIVIGPLLNGTFLEREPTRPNDEIKIALAGPCTNLLLAASLAGGLALSNRPAAQSWLTESLRISLWIHLLMGLVNLLPGLPLDGGKVLRGLLGRRFPWLIATRLAVRAGTAVALCLPVLCLLNPLVQENALLLLMIVALAVAVWRASLRHLPASHRREMELQWSNGNPPEDPEVQSRWPPPPPLPPGSYRPLTPRQYEKWRKICEAACRRDLGLSPTA